MEIGTRRPRFVDSHDDPGSSMAVAAR